MNAFLKLLGVNYSAKQSVPTPDEAIEKLREVEERLRVKQNYLGNKLKEEELDVIKNVSDNKVEAKEALKRKNMNQKQLKEINNTLSTIESQRKALESAKINTEVLEIMGESTEVLKLIHNDMNIDKINDLMDELKEQQQLSEEIIEAIGSPNGCDPDLDDQLLRVLEDMEQKKSNKLLIDTQPQPQPQPIRLPNIQPIQLHNTAIPLPPPEVTVENPNTTKSDNQLIENNHTVTEVVMKKEIYNNYEIDCDIDEEELYSVYKSFDINFDQLNKKYTFLRLNTIHMRGVQEMSKEDVLQYFGNYNPKSFERVSDLSCNIIFHNEKESAIAMIRLTKALVLKSNEIIDDLGIDVVDGESLSVPIPQGFRWRLGFEHKKSKALLMRFATNSDKSYEPKEKRRRLSEDQSHEVYSSDNRRSVWDRLDTDRHGNHCAVNQMDNRVNYRQSISVVKSKKLIVIDKNDLRNKLNGRKPY